MLVRHPQRADVTVFSATSTVPPGSEQAGSIDASGNGPAIDAQCGDQLVLHLAHVAGGSFVGVDSTLDIP